MPTKKAARKRIPAKKRPPARQKAFLLAYSLCGNRTQAARAVECDRTLHYVWLKNPEYAKAFEQAQEEFCENIEAEIRRRGMDGIDEPVIYQGKLSYLPMVDVKTGEVLRDEAGRLRPSDQPLTVRKYSDNLLMFLAKAVMPEKYRDSVHIEGKVNSEALAERLAAGRARVAAAKEKEAA